MAEEAADAPVATRTIHYINPNSFISLLYNNAIVTQRTDKGSEVIITDKKKRLLKNYLKC